MSFILGQLPGPLYLCAEFSEQICRHLASIGHPVLGDSRHGHAPSNRHFAEKHGLDRPFLHCMRIVLVSPQHKEGMAITAPMPGDLAMVLERAGGDVPAAPTVR